jgi:hypothetical protein
MISHDVPDQPWTKLASDIMTFRGHDYLGVVDYTSKYPEVIRTSKTAEGVITALKPILARHGIPQEIVSDNMPFSSHVMINFAAEWGFRLTTSSPTYA